MHQLRLLFIPIEASIKTGTTVNCVVICYYSEWLKWTTTFHRIARNIDKLFACKISYNRSTSFSRTTWTIRRIDTERRTLKHSERHQLWTFHIKKDASIGRLVNWSAPKLDMRNDVQAIVEIIIDSGGQTGAVAMGPHERLQMESKKWIHRGRVSRHSSPQKRRTLYTRV